MAHITLALTFLYLCLVRFGQLSECYIDTGNGGIWGDWGPVEWCPSGCKVKGFALQVQENQGPGDDTAVKGIRLFCFDQDGTFEATIQSTESEWGTWGDTFICSNGLIESFKIKVEADQGDGDDTALNNIMVKCSDGETLEDPGSPWGTYGSWSLPCKLGICGMKTKVQPPQGSGDDTAINDVQMHCCYE